MDLPFTPEQEDIVIKEMKAIQNAFNLGQGLKYTYPFGNTDFHQHYVKDGQIWELCTSLQGDYNDENKWRPLVLSGEIESYTAWNEKFADSINELAYQMWESKIGVDSLFFAEEQLHKKFDSQYPTDSWVEIAIQSKHDEKIGFWIDAPKELAVPMDYPLENNRFAKVYLIASEISKQTLQDCVDFYNESYQLAYDYELSMWQGIHQFINDYKMNERLGLQNPPFSLNLYQIQQRPMIHAQDFL